MRRPYVSRGGPAMNGGRPYMNLMGPWAKIPPPGPKINDTVLRRIDLPLGLPEAGRVETPAVTRRLSGRFRQSKVIWGTAQI
jgi:hypothetical protein